MDSRGIGPLISSMPWKRDNRYATSPKLFGAMYLERTLCTAGESRTPTPLRTRALKALVSAIPPPQQKDVRAVIITWVREKRKGIDIFPYICLTRFMTRFRPPLARLQRGKEGG